MAIKTKIGARRRLAQIKRELEPLQAEVEKPFTEDEAKAILERLRLIKHELLGLRDVVDEIEAADAR